jgi:hypothetical protein
MHFLYSNCNKNDAPPKFFKDSNASLKVKIMKEERVGECSLICNITGVKRACWRFGMGTRTNDKWVNYSHGFAQTKQQVGWCILWTFFGAHTYTHTRNHKTHHGPNLGEATTFPFIIFSMIFHGGYTQMSFFSRLLSWKSWNFQN